VKINNNLNPRVQYYSPRSGLTQNSRTVQRMPIKEPKKTHSKKIVVLLIAFIVISSLVYAKAGAHTTISYGNSIGNSATNSKTVIPAVSACSSNTLAKKVVVVISQQHLYACQFNKPVFNSAVITGYQGSPENITPVGNYTIFKKFTNVNLTGSDDLGSWNVHVSYWMPFLFNQYGAYGFHDATWRTPNDFGNISPTSTNASHGCVECPLATAKWLYSWLNVGTNITIENQA